MLVHAGGGIGANEVTHRVGLSSVVIGQDLNFGSLAFYNTAGLGVDHHVAGISSGAGFHAGADDGRLGPNAGYGLTLHICTHQSAGGVVVLNKRYQ